MHNLDKPKNQWALVIWLLLENGSQGVTMAKACNDHFHKFQTRLLELEKPRKDKIKILRIWTSKENRFGHRATFYNYKSVASIHYLIGLYKKINIHGMSKQKQATV